jgi:putative sterol carrier protein
MPAVHGHVTQPEEFFAGLAQRGREPLLEKATGVIRVEIVGADGAVERWIVAIDHGDIAVSHRNVAGDCRLRMSHEVFERIAAGELSARAGMLRGAIEADGDWRLLVLSQRLFQLGEERQP